ncbi:MAG: beta-lactamase family protein [Clostridia bacterium]|nr:beta-lactamase family protein [Clostridia bacterium]
MKKLNPDKLETIIAETTNARLADGRLGHAEIIVNQDGVRVYHRYFGTNGVNGPAIDGNCLYRAASMTKPFTTAAVMQCVERGLIDLKAPITDYLPGFARPMVAHAEQDGEGAWKLVYDHPARNTILVYHLLSHTSGIGSDSLLSLQKLTCGSPKATTAYYAEQPIAFDPYSAQSYSPSAAFDVAARIVELVTGEDFGPYVLNHICKPLGLTDTTFEPSDAQYDRIVTMYNRQEDGHGCDMPSYPRGCVFGDAPASAWVAGAGLLTSGEDYSKFAEMLLNLGMGANGTRILSEWSVREMQTPYVPEAIMNWDNRWGLGVRVVTRATYGNKLPIGAWGWSGAYGTHFWVDPENRITAVYMKNSAYDGGSGAESSAEFERSVMAALE